MDTLETSTAYNLDDDYSSVTGVSPCPLDEITEFTKNFLPPFYCIIFTVSLLGNGLVLFIMFKFERLNTVTNIFLINLVVSNLIFTMNLPFQVIYHKSEWTFGPVICKIVGGTYYLGFYSSVLFLTLMTFDRYLAVVHVVVATKHRRSCYAFTLSSVTWIVSALASLEPFITYTVDQELNVGTLCEASDPDNKIMSPYVQFVIFFIFPLVVVLYCYIRIGLRVLATRGKGKHRTVKVIFFIVVLFFICWMPYNVILIMKEQISNACDYSLDYPQYVTHNIAHLYFCVSPVFYTFLGKKFQNHMRQLLVNEVPCLKNHLTMSASSRSFS